MSLQEMEDMGFKYQFRCPLWKNEVKLVVHEENQEERTITEKTKYYCQVCDKDVYTATTKEQVKEYVSKGFCFQFRRKKPPLLKTIKLSEEFPQPVMYGTGVSSVATSSMQEVRNIR